MVKNNKKTNNMILCQIKMPYFHNLKNNLLEFRIICLLIRCIGLDGLYSPFSPNQETDEGVSGLVGSVLLVREKLKILAKGGLIGPLIKRLFFCGTNYVSLIPEKTLKMYIWYIVMRLRILHKVPREPSLERVITYHSSNDLVWDSAVDPKTGNVAVITQSSFEVWKLISPPRRIFRSGMKHSSCSNSVAFGNGDVDSILAVCSNDNIDLYKGSICIQKMTSSATINTVQFSPDGGVLVICLSTNIVQVFKKKDSDDGTEEWVCVETLPDQTAEITSVDFYQPPKNLILAIGLGDNTIKIWDISSDKTQTSSCVDTLTGHSSWVTGVSFHPYFKTLASGSNDKTVKVWSQNANGKFICRLTLEHGSPVSSVAFSPSGFLVSGGSIVDMCKIWRLIMSAKRVNAELVLTKFVESGIDELFFCPITGNLQIRHYDGVSTL